jgi:hypothetical protein
MSKSRCLGLVLMGTLGVQAFSAQAQSTLNSLSTNMLTPPTFPGGAGNAQLPNIPLTIAPSRGSASTSTLFGGLRPTFTNPITGEILPAGDAASPRNDLLGRGTNPLGGLFGGDGSNNPLGGVLGGGGGSANPLGGLFGVDGSNNPLGGILGGGGANSLGGSTGSDLVSTIQGFIGQITRLVQNPLEFLNVLQGQAPLGESLAAVEQAIQTNKGSMGLPDLAKANADVMAADSANPSPYLAPDIFRLKVGQVSSRATISHAQTVLGREGQELQLKGMTAITKSIQTAGGVVPVAVQTAGQVAQFAQQSGKVAQTVAQSAQQNAQIASQTTASAGKIKAAISTQDAIKGLGEQNAQIANILSGVSGQMGGSSNQLSTVAAELSGLSTQQAQASQQLGEVAAIGGDQAVSLRNLQVTGALSNVNLREMNQMMYGQQRRAALERQTHALLPTTGFFRLSQ